MEKNNMFETFLEIAGKIEEVKVDREDFLRKTFKRKYKGADLEQIIEKGPIEAGIEKEEISKIANQTIKNGTRSTTIKSFLSGIPGGMFVAVTIPYDVMQIYMQTFIVVQKLMYLYGWEENIFDDFGELDDATQNAITLFVGLMFGVGEAGKVLTKISGKFLAKTAGKHVLKTFFKNGLERKLILTIIKKIGVRTTVKIAGKGVTKAVPLLGGAVSGLLTYSTFYPMCKKLKDYFETGEVELKEVASDDDVIEQELNADNKLGSY